VHDNDRHLRGASTAMRPAANHVQHRVHLELVVALDVLEAVGSLTTAQIKNRIAAEAGGSVPPRNGMTSELTLGARIPSGATREEARSLARRVVVVLAAVRAGICRGGDRTGPGAPRTDVANHRY
jgi:hypothetical protein